ncbi:hypothetical protein [Mycolicibacterium stellerae]|uniref:hypothetical protein n=1 Tax=Mycolicibacterium stellerae TaxID=2358193 RepID=UPI000F0BD9C9|nr:hypothetical protein [Mycolicibacterium stellerae]
MKNYMMTGLIGAGMTAATLALAGAATAAPTGPTQVEETVKTLEASGYNVVLNRTGAAPLSSCTVKEVRPGQTHKTFDSRGSSTPSETIVAETVYVDLAC